MLGWLGATCVNVQLRLPQRASEEVSSRFDIVCSARPRRGHSSEPLVHRNDSRAHHYAGRARRPGPPTDVDAPALGVRDTERGTFHPAGADTGKTRRRTWTVVKFHTCMARHVFSNVEQCRHSGVGVDNTMAVHGRADKKVAS